MDPERMKKVTTHVTNDTNDAKTGTNAVCMKAVR
jgi:hypothetical protein